MGSINKRYSLNGRIYYFSTEDAKRLGATLVETAESVKEIPKDRKPQKPKMQKQ